MEHIFTQTIKSILKKNHGDLSDYILKSSFIIRYLNIKTKSANKGSKSRGSFHPLAVIYVLIEDYINGNFHQNNMYKDYEGAIFTSLKDRASKKDFCRKIQNHSFNNRVNSEFEKFFKGEVDFIPICRNLDTKKYKINENLLLINDTNIAKDVLEIIDSYFLTKKNAFDNFIKVCQDLQTIEVSDSDNVKKFIDSMLQPNTDARLFEIVSYSILKYHYCDQILIWGFDLDNLKEDKLRLFKTGRTNANDGGIDFVMQPLGRFFQVTETIDFKKYFLDIDKIQKYPISFVIKSEESLSILEQKIRDNAVKIYSIKSIVDKYMNCIEELINIPTLREIFLETIDNGYLKSILEEIILQSKFEFDF